ncbi:MAG: hypothetical protein ACJAR2_003691 [Ilumatobacter sp.]
MSWEIYNSEFSHDRAIGNGDPQVTNSVIH